MSVEIAAALVAAALVGGFAAGRWWGQIRMLRMLAILANASPTQTLVLLRRVSASIKRASA